MELIKRFNDFLDKINLYSDSNEKQILVENFISGIKDNYPLYESETEVVLLYKGEAEKVKIIGDMTEWSHMLELKKIEGTDLHYIYFKLKTMLVLSIRIWLMIMRLLFLIS